MSVHMLCDAIFFFFTFNIVTAHKQEEFDTMFLHLNNVYYKLDHLIKTRP